MPEKGEEGAAFSVLALLLTVGRCGRFSRVNEIGRGRATVSVGEPARRGGERRWLGGHLAGMSQIYSI